MLGLKRFCFKITFTLYLKRNGVIVMKPIVLPTLNWFNFGNAFTGSIGTEKGKGCLTTTTFNYKVKKINNNTLLAICWFILPWNAKTNMDEATIGFFNADDFGIEVAENWIIQKCFMDYQPLDGLPAKYTELISN